MTKFIKLLIKNHWVNFQTNLAQCILGWKDSSLFKYPFSRGDNYEIAKIHWRNLKNIFLRTFGPILTKLEQSILGWSGFQLFFFSNEGPALFQGEIITKNKNTLTKFIKLLIKNHWVNFQTNLAQCILGWKDSSLFKYPFSRGDNYEIAKIHWRNLKNIFLRTFGPILTKLEQSILGWSGFQLFFFSNEGPALFQGEIITKNKNTLTKFKTILPKNNWTNLNQTLTQYILRWRGFKFVQMKGPAFFKGVINYYELEKYIDEILNFFSEKPFNQF